MTMSSADITPSFESQPEADDEITSTTGGLEDIRNLVKDDLTPAPPVTSGGEQHGQFAPIWRWLAQAQHEKRPRIHHPRIGLFMAAHGAFPERQQNLNATLHQLQEAQHPITPLAEVADCDLQVYELDLTRASADFRKEPALTPEAASHAVSYGLMTIQPGIDFLAIAALNPVADFAGDRIAAALKEKTDPFKALLLYGGVDIAAMFGLVIAAQLARVPVVLEGKGALAAGALLQRLRPDAVSHLRNVNNIQPKQAATAKLGTAGALVIPFLKTIAHNG